MTESVSPSRTSEKLLEYQRWRTIGRRLNMRLVESLDKKELNEAGKRLGLLHKGVFHFDTEDTATVLMDFALFHVRRNGQNALERRLAQSPPTDPDELTWLQAVCQARYRILQVTEVYRGFGMQTRDIFRDETEVLVDVNLSRTVPRHSVMAGHVYRVSDYWIATGAALPVEPEILEELSAQMPPRFGRQPEDYRRLSPEQETELATLVIRKCLEGGMSEHVRYGTPPPRPHYDPAPVAPPAPHRVGRNDPCPCGSRRKFKKCCYREGPVAF